MPQPAGHASGRGRLDRGDVAGHDDGQLRARSVLAGFGPARNHRSPGGAPRRSRTSAPPVTCRWPNAWPEPRAGPAPFSRTCLWQRPALDSERGLAADGVSCTVCHQVDRADLGTPASFNGEFQLIPPAEDGSRRIVGPHPVDRGRRRIMRSVTGFEQVEGPYSAESELCASCHTLITEALAPDGTVIGSLAGADELPGVAAQRVRSRRPELPVVPHAADRRADADCVGAR